MKTLTTICAMFVSGALMFGQSAARKDAAITAVTGESWLHHLNRSFDETSMGKTWRLGPATDESAPGLQRSMTVLSDSTTSSTRTETLRGSDLYRLNCQGCHGETGLGAPPEIGSLIDPVRATSVVLVTLRMKKIGMEMSSGETAQLVNQSRSALLKRLHEGGTDMPSFHHLSEAEISSLVAYLNQLAGVPGAEKKQVAIQESTVRIGELIAKSTCHTCHDATGPNPTPAELADSAIPPLNVLPARVNQAQLVRKVTSGAPVIMGKLPLVYRGRMPVFSYLSENEAADVYEYLTQYPPTESAIFSQTAQTTRSDATDPPTDSSEAHLAVPQNPSSGASVPLEETNFVLPVGMGLFTTVLLALGCWITLREFRRLSVESRARTVSRRNPRIEPASCVSARRGVETGRDSPIRQAESLRREFGDFWEEEKVS